MAPSEDPHLWQRQVRRPCSNIRYGIRKCNTFDCKCDEVCIAKQNLVLAIDASGSFRDHGYRVLKNFANGLIAKYMGTYYRTGT